MKRADPALLVILAGVTAALHVGKLPPALPALRDALGIGLLEAGFMLSLVQLAGMSLGLAVGLAADGVGLKRTMLAGLLVLSAASLLGSVARDGTSLLVLRALEGLGFLLACMPAPSLIRQWVAPERLTALMGLWGAYMPLGTALALLLGPVVILVAGWRAWWLMLGVLSLVMAAWLWRALPAVRPGAGAGPPVIAGAWQLRLRQTLTSAGPWLVALSFAVYSAQWLAVIGFLPSVYAQAGLAPAWVGVATALAAAVNMVGNIASGRLLQRGVAAHVLLYTGFATMGLGGVLAFAPLFGAWPPDAGAVVRYVAVLVFSAVGGMIPGTLFSLAVRLAPGEGTVSTTVGWMQQCSAMGQFAGPPLVAWVATRSGGWQWSWTVIGACALAGGFLAACIRRYVGRSSTPSEARRPT